MVYTMIICTTHIQINKYLVPITKILVLEVCGIDNEFCAFGIEISSSHVKANSL
jgi:hypothetical protein